MNPQKEASPLYEGGADADVSPEERELAELEAARALRHANLERQRVAQRIIDLRGINAAEDEHGASNIAVVEVNFAPGLPTLCAAKAPSDAYVKRFRHMVKPRRKRGADDEQAPTVDAEDAIKAAEEVAVACLVYPTPELFAKLCEARPNVGPDLGTAALKLVRGRAEQKGKA